MESTTNMPQKRDQKEETELKVPESLPVCTPAQTIIAPPPPQLQAARPPHISDPSSADLRTRSASTPEKKSDLISPAEARVTLKRPREVNRCSGSGCRKRIGLTGFQCRCGDTFCSEHRYSDRHDCSYDYKAAGRDAIAKQNPVVRAAKLLKV